MAGQSKLRQPVAGKNTCSICGAVVQRLWVHMRNKHLLSTDCILCQRKLVDTTSLMKHLKGQHGHMLGFLLPVTEVVEEMQKFEYPVNIHSIGAEIRRWGIPDLGGTWMRLDEYFVSFDKIKMRPLLTVELLTPHLLEIRYDEEQPDLPYLFDNDLPSTQCPVEGMRRRDRNVSHLATSANHRQSEAQNNTTFLLRNLVYLHSNVNKGIMTSVEKHLTQVARNWWKSVLITVAVYDESPILPHGLPQPTHICKLMILGDQQVLGFTIANKVGTEAEICNFLDCRSTMSDFNELTGLNMDITLPFSWDVPLWKCDECRFMNDDWEEVQLHVRFAHKDKYCPVHRRRHRRRHRDSFDTFEAYKAHVNSFERQCCEEAGCNAWCYNRKELSHHVLQVHTEATIPCTAPDCDKKFKTNKDLKRHLESHKTNRVRNPCPFCEKTYPNKGTLANHIRMKHRTASSSSPTRVSTTHTNNPPAVPPEAHIAILTEENQSLAAENQSLTAENQSLAADNQALTEENARLHQELTLLRRAAQPSTFTVGSKRPRRK